MFYIFCCFALLDCGEKNILPNLTNLSGARAGFFWPLRAGAARKKNSRSRSRFGKNQEPEPEPLEKKSEAGAGAAKKFAGSQALTQTVLAVGVR